LSEAVWSPDGQSLLVVASAPGDISVTRLELVAPSTGASRVLTSPADWRSDTSPAWSPDGEWIMFQRSGATSELWAIRPNGSDEHLIATGVQRTFWLPSAAEGRRG
jgi:TolB protein